MLNYGTWNLWIQDVSAELWNTQDVSAELWNTQDVSAELWNTQDVSAELQNMEPSYKTFMLNYRTWNLRIQDISG